MSQTTEDLKTKLNDISDEKHTILDIFYYAKTEFGVRRDLILVVYIWDCLGRNYETSKFENVEDCINYFRDANSKTALCDISSRNSIHSQAVIPT